jgi:TRAP transporter 4TM/12TM fusion protein
MERIKPGSFWFFIFLIFSAALLFLSVNQMFRLSLGGFKPVDNSYLYYMIASALSLVFLYYPATSSAPKNRVPWYDAGLFFATVTISIYLGIIGMEIISLGWEYRAPLLPSIASVILWALVLESVRRASDLSMMLFCLVFSFYPLFASVMPGILQGQAYDFLTTARQHSLGMNSILGIPLFTVCTLLIGFMLFGVILASTGGGTFFFNIAQSLLGTSRGGAAKIGIVGSCLFGMLSGSSVSNALTIGSMTIPAMKRTGFAPHYAAAIESCASAGGPIMPPVMGAAAFVMASFLNISYVQVALAALIPALLYYLGLFVQVDGYAAKTGLKGIPRENLPSFWTTFKDGWLYFFVIVVLCYFLLTLRKEAQAPYFASAVLIAVGMLKKETRLTGKAAMNMVIDCGKVVAQLIAILAAAGLIVGGLSVTGVALSFSRELVVAMGNNTLLILMIGAITSFVLGLGMTTTACYIFLAIVMVPALVKLGIYSIGAHLFVLYWGALSELTPPVALCVAAACGIAGSEFMKTGWTAMRLGAVKYIIPFFFVYAPPLLVHGTFWEILEATLFATVGIIVTGSALEGYMIGVGELKSLIMRMTLLGAGLLTAFPERLSTIIGLIIIAVSFPGYSFLKKKRAREIPHTPKWSVDQEPGEKQ